MTTNYTIPVLCSKDRNGDFTNDWFVYFEYTYNDKVYPRKLREGINRIKSLKQRQIEGEALAEARHEWLRLGWNPVTDPQFKLRNIKGGNSIPGESKDQVANLPVVAALKWALKKKKLAPKSRSGYASHLEHFEKAAMALSYNYLPIKDFRRFGAKSLLEQVETDQNLSAHGYNKYRDTLSSMCGELVTWEIIEYNPATKIESREVAESDKYQPLTPKEKQDLAEYLYQHHFLFFVYNMVIYHTGIRPKEVLALRINCVDLETRTITITPNPDEENAKTKKIRKVPICDELASYIEDLGLWEYPDSHYVFGSPFKGRGGYRRGTTNGAGGAMREDYFRPSANRIKRDTVTTLWRVVVKKGLGIDKFMYGLKRTGGDDKILAGVDLDALRSMYGHGSKKMTEIYAKEIRNVYKKEIIEKSPAFTSQPGK